MAEYVKFRLATAKVGVSMALLALIAGVAEKARAASNPAAKPAASGGIFLKLGGLGHTIASDFSKIEKKLIKLDSSISSLALKEKKLEGTVAGLYKPQKIDTTFLKIADANKKFLPADGTATNSQKLGNLSPNQFFQGSGNVVSGALSSLNGDGSARQLLSLPGGIIVVSIAHPPAGGFALTIHNATGQTLLGVIAVNGGGAQSLTLKNGDNQLLLPAVQTSGEVQLQIFPGAGFSNVVSILIGLTPNPSTQQTEAVAQAFTGGV